MTRRPPAPPYPSVGEPVAPRGFAGARHSPHLAAPSPFRRAHADLITLEPEQAIIAAAVASLDVTLRTRIRALPSEVLLALAVDAAAREVAQGGLDDEAYAAVPTGNPRGAWLATVHPESLQDDEADDEMDLIRADLDSDAEDYARADEEGWFRADEDDEGLYAEDADGDDADEYGEDEEDEEDEEDDYGDVDDDFGEDDF